MKKNISVIQNGFKECGSACLLSLIRYYGGNISMERIVELTYTDKDGTNFYNLLSAAKEIGLSGMAYKVDDVNSLLNIDKPFISQIIINHYKHFVVIYRMRNDKVVMMDPAKGMVTVKLEQYLNMWTGYILILEPIKKLPIYNDDNYLKITIKNILYQNKRMIINILILSLVATIFTCFYSYYFKILIDYVISTSKTNLLVITIIFIVILTIKFLTQYLRNNLLMYLNQKIDLSIITTTISKIISLPFSYYKNKTTGEMISRVNDLFYIKNVIVKIITTLFLDMLLSVTVLIVLLTINTSMTILLFIIAIFYFLIFIISKESIKNITNVIQEDSAKTNSILVESLTNYETVKGLNLEVNFKNKINRQYLKLINNNFNLNKLNYSLEFLKDLFEGIGIIFIIYLGIMKVMDKSLTIGSLITYNTLIYYFLNPIRNTFDFYQDYYYTKNSIKRINNILNYKCDKLDDVSNLCIFGDIIIRNLEFSYNPYNKILNGISMNIKKGTKLLILGKSGSGKSTLLKILYKYYDVGRDKVFINNYDINDYRLLDIRRNITYISQDEHLFTDTIRNNIILDREISEEEFLKVCTQVYLPEIVKDKLESYNFMLEENGVNLSGGQRQRIVLARALLKKSCYLLIDEGLNEIDINLERKILKNIFEYYHDKTIIIVSHRRENMDLYDQVINLDNGTIKDVLNKYDK